MAKTILKQQAKKLAKHGRKGDTELVHMSKDEVRGLTAMGTLTTNPKTGLKEAFKLSSLFKPATLLGIAAAVALPELLPGIVGTAAVPGEAALGELGINTALEAGTVGGVAAGTTAADIAATGAGTGILGAAGITQGAADVLSGAGTVVSGLKTAATIINPIMSLAGAVGGVKAAKDQANAISAIANKDTTPLTVAPPVPMPTAGNADTLNAMRANIQEQVVRRGRAATILTSPSDGTKLGS